VNVEALVHWGVVAPKTNEQTNKAADKLRAATNLCAKVSHDAPKKKPTK